MTMPRPKRKDVRSAMKYQQMDMLPSAVHTLGNPRPQPDPDKAWALEGAYKFAGMLRAMEDCSESVAGCTRSHPHELMSPMCELRTIIARLENQMAQLPKTADGTPIVPGMTVYCVNGAHVDERRVVGPYGKVALLTREPARHGCGEGDSHRLASTVFANRDAACNQAKEKP